MVDAASNAVISQDTGDALQHSGMVRGDGRMDDMVGVADLDRAQQRGSLLDQGEGMAAHMETDAYR
ncbi:hypothetical protein [Streptomyces luteireticuli]|uniref:hypothetical protein n=1 Tax=Streptomyces luteireticuli TaxID=173858 RepID=UPI00355682A9